MQGVGTGETASLIDGSSVGWRRRLVHFPSAVGSPERFSIEESMNLVLVLVGHARCLGNGVCKLSMGQGEQGGSSASVLERGAVWPDWPGSGEHLSC